MLVFLAEYGFVNVDLVEQFPLEVLVILNGQLFLHYCSKEVVQEVRAFCLQPTAAISSSRQ